MAKFGIALGSGPRGLGFESRYSDQVVASILSLATTFFCIKKKARGQFAGTGPLLLLKYQILSRIASAYALQVAPLRLPVTVTSQVCSAFSSFSAASVRQIWRSSMASAFKMLAGFA